VWVVTIGIATFAHYVEAVESGEDFPLDLLSTTGQTTSPYLALRALVARGELRSKGTFFTGDAMADRLWLGVLDSLSDASIIVDPACGAGDLLLPAASEIMRRGLSASIRAFDINEDFTRVARVRLSGTGIPKVDSMTRDFVSDQSSLKDATHVVLNPPFIPVAVDEAWASGTVNSAASFVMIALEAMQQDAVLLAVLPDVLRSGTRYEAWRQRVESLGQVESIDLMGKFDAQTDVDVFALRVLVGGSRPGVGWTELADASQSLGEYIDVRVGAVVPHRHEETGVEVPYVTARSLSSGEGLVRKFQGRLDAGPMILVNRTSRPGERPRVRARVHTDETPIAVENHLLILKPKPDSGVSLEQLLSVLADPRTVDFLDGRIRCRHLTVSAIKEIPWPS
jgi:hypothetical protein